MTNKQPVPCKRCSTPTLHTGTKLCDQCWETIRNVGSLTVDDLPIKLVRAIATEAWEAGYFEQRDDLWYRETDDEGTIIPGSDTDYHLQAFLDERWPEDPDHD